MNTGTECKITQSEWNLCRRWKRSASHTPTKNPTIRPISRSFANDDKSSLLTTQYP